MSNTDLGNFFLCLYFYQVYHTVEALRLNAKQISGYLDLYTQKSTDLNKHRVFMLQQHLHATEQRLQDLVTELFISNFAENAHQTLHDLENQYSVYIKQVRSMCQEVWAKFDMMSITLGTLMLLVVILVNVYLFVFETNVTEGKGIGTLLIVLGVSGMSLGFCVIQTVFLEGKAVTILAFILGVCDLIVIVIIIVMVHSNKSQRTQKQKQNLGIMSYFFANNFTLEHFFSYFCIFISLCCFFTNSFVVNEDSVTLFLSETMIWVFCIRCVQGLLREGKSVKDFVKTKSKVTKNFDLMKHFTQPVAIVILLSFICNACLRISSNFRSCREEQITEGNCTNSMFLYPLSSVGYTVEGNKNIRYFFCVSCLTLCSYLSRKWMSTYGNLNGGNMAVLCGRYLLLVTSVMTALHWAVQVGNN